MPELLQINPRLAGLEPYDPKYLPARIYLNANESPWGVPDVVYEHIEAAVRQANLSRYPAPLADELRQTIAAECGLDASRVLVGNGGDELIFDLLLAYGGPGRKLLIAPPSFSSYEIDARLTGTELVNTLMRNSADGRLDEAAILQRLAAGDISLVMLGSPNNPTGDCLSADFVEQLLDSSAALVLIDQAYVEFADPSFDLTSLLARHRNLLLLRTFSKAFALAGLRLGYLLAAPEIVSALTVVRQPYSVDSLSALAGIAALQQRAAYLPGIAEIIRQRQRLYDALAATDDIAVRPSEANFLLFEVLGADGRAHLLWQRLYQEHGILLRDFSAAHGLQGCLRVTVGTPAENDEFLEALCAML
jgi:histidinol-phosphate aminotransferase